MDLRRTELAGASSSRGLAGYGLGKASAILFALSALALPIGFVREIILAYFFGASAELDVFYVSSLPIEIMALVGPTLAWALIPMLAEVRANVGKSELSAALRAVLSTVLVASAALAVLSFLSSRALVGLTAPGFDPAQSELAAWMMSLLALGVTLTALGGLITGALNFHHHFWTPVAGGAIVSSSVILTVSILGRGLGIKAVALGTLFGLALQTTMLLHAFCRAGLRLEIGTRWRHPGLTVFSGALWPLLAQALLGRAYIFVDRYLASTLPEGSISVLSYATRVSTLPVVLVLSGIGTVLYPQLTELGVEQRVTEFLHDFTRAMRAAFLLVTPAVALLAALGGPIIGLLFQRGAFGAQDTDATASLMLWYSLGIVAWVGADLGTKALWALKETRTTLTVSLLFFAANAGTAIALVGPFGLSGLAIARTVAMVVYALATFYVLRSRVATTFLAPLGVFLLKVMISACIAGSVGFLVSTWLAASFGSAPLAPLARLLCAASAIILVYLLAISKVFRLREAMELKRIMVSRSSGPVRRLLAWHRVESIN